MLLFLSLAWEDWFTAHEDNLVLMEGFFFILLLYVWVSIIITRHALIPIFNVNFFCFNFTQLHQYLGEYRLVHIGKGLWNKTIGVATSKFPAMVTAKEVKDTLGMDTFAQIPQTILVKKAANWTIPLTKILCLIGQVYKYLLGYRFFSIKRPRRLF